MNIFKSWGLPFPIPLLTFERACPGNEINTLVSRYTAASIPWGPEVDKNSLNLKENREDQIVEEQKAFRAEQSVATLRVAITESR